MEKEFISSISQNLIDEIINLRNSGKTYKQILSNVDISEDKLIKVCRSLGMNTATVTTSTKLDSVEVIAYYTNVKSLRKTATYFKTTRDTIRKFIPADLRRKGREKLVTQAQAVIDWRKRTKIKLVEYKGGKCQNPNCGYNKCIAALEFHHINPNEKDFSISAKSYSFERLKQEVDKCVMLCSNCHTEVHNDILKVDKNGGVAQLV